MHPLDASPIGGAAGRRARGHINIASLPRSANRGAEPREHALQACRSIVVVPRPAGGAGRPAEPPGVLPPLHHDPGRRAARASLSLAIQVGPGSTCVLERGGRRPTPPLRARRGPRFQGNKSSICPTEGRTVRGGGRRRRGSGPEETHTPQPPPREESARSTHRCVVRGPPGDVRGRSGQERHGRPPTGSARQHFGAHCAPPRWGAASAVLDGVSLRGRHGEDRVKRPSRGAR